MTRLTAAAVLVLLLAGCGADTDRDDAERTFTSFASTYCAAFETGAADLKACRDDWVDTLLQQWEDADRPDPATVLP